MSDEQEQERDGYPEATTIGPNVNAAQLELDIDAISRRTRKFLVEQQNTIDRLTAERDAARAAVERLREERDAYKAAAKRISDEKQATIDMLCAALNDESEVSK